MLYKKFFVFLLLTLALSIMIGAFGVPSAAAQTAICAQTYVVKQGDWLSTIAQNLLGDVKAYTTIYDATNAAAKADSSFATLTDPNKIEVGQKLCVPAKTNVTPPPSAQGPGPVIPSPAGTYTAVGPAADASALVETVILTEDFKASYINDYVGKVRITDTGTWTTQNSNIVLNLTNEDGKTINQTLTLQMNKDGNLESVEGRPVTYVKTKPEVEALSALYTANRPSADGSQTLVALTLLPNGVAQMNITTKDGGFIVQTGTWQVAPNPDTGAQSVTVNLDKQDNQTINDKYVLQVQDNLLRGTDYNKDKWGTDLTFTKFEPPTQPQTPASASGQLAAITGSYTEQLPAADAIGRVIVLDLQPNNTATLTTQFIGKGSPIVEAGTWTMDAGKVAVTLDTKSSGKQTLVFVFDNGALVLQDPVAAGYGNAGLKLTRVGVGNPASAEFGGASFSFDLALAHTAQGEKLEAVPVSEGPALGGGRPATIRFLFDGQKAQDFFDRRLAQVYVFKADDWTKLDPTTAQRVADLKTLLKDKPTTFDKEIPVLPFIGATQVFRVKPQYLNFQNGSGIGFVTYYAQDVSPVTADTIFYTFQGLTNDGKYYVAVFWPVTTVLLPKDANTALGGQSYDAWAKGYQQYLTDLTNALNGLVPAAYTPNLTLIENLVQSINVGDKTLE